MSERNYYVICDSGCRFPAMTKEQILAAIEQAISTGAIRDVDTGFVTKIKEQNKNAPVKFWVGTMAEYNAIEEKEANCFYITTDDVSYADLCEELANEIKALRDDFKIVGDMQKFISVHGLGTAARNEWDDVDDIYETGWYCFAGGVSLGGSEYDRAYMRVDAFDENFGSQCLYIVSPTSGIEKFYRFSHDGVWSEWESENPPMIENIEYRTTERFNGLPVYTQWVTVTAPADKDRHAQDIPNTSKCFVIRHTAFEQHGGSIGQGVNFPQYGEYVHVKTFVNTSSNISVIYERGEDQAKETSSVCVQVWYIKV